MQMPVMQAEWQRRQTQRPVLALLGLLALLSQAPAALDSLPLGQRGGPEIASVQQADSRPTVNDGQRTGRTQTQARYWRALGTETDGGARLRLALHADARPTVSSHDVYLRRFLRPPTR